MRLTMREVVLEGVGRLHIVVNAGYLEAPEIAPTREALFSSADRLLSIIGIEVVLFLSEEHMRLTAMFPEAESWEVEDALEAVYQCLDSELSHRLD
jgi:hypothetical protein